MFATWTHSLSSHLITETPESNGCSQATQQGLKLSSFSLSILFLDIIRVLHE